MARPGKCCGWQCRQRRIRAGPAEGGRDRAHEVDQAAATIVGQRDSGVLLPCGGGTGFGVHVVRRSGACALIVQLLIREMAAAMPSDPQTRATMEKPFARHLK